KEIQKSHSLLSFIPLSGPSLAKKMDSYHHLSPLSLLHRIKDSFHSAVSAILANLFSALFTFFFALVGSLLGALTGALIGQETETGFMRGAVVGAISGAVFSIDVLESSLLLWQSDESGIACLLYLIDVIASLLSGRLVRERIGPAMLSAVQSQMGAMESQFQDQTDIFGTAVSKGLTGDSLDRIPKVLITDNTSGEEMVSCSVCLQGKAAMPPPRVEYTGVFERRGSAEKIGVQEVKNHRHSDVVVVDVEMPSHASLNIRRGAITCRLFF
ncbi:unnamed protein product, partial [Brassica napus]